MRMLALNGCRVNSCTIGVVTNTSGVSSLSACEGLVLCGALAGMGPSAMTYSSPSYRSFRSL